MRLALQVSRTRYLYEPNEEESESFAVGPTPRAVFPSKSPMDGPLLVANNGKKPTLFFVIVATIFSTYSTSIPMHTNNFVFDLTTIHHARAAGGRAAREHP